MLEEMIDQNNTAFIRQKQGKKILLLTVILAITLLDVLIFSISNVIIDIALTAVLFYFIPGFLGSLLLFDSTETKFDTIDRIILGFGIGIVISTCSLFAFNFLPIEFNKVNLVIFTNLIIISISLFILRRPKFILEAKSDLTASELLLLCVIFLITLYFRFMFLGYSEMQGDEVEVANIAKNLVNGQSDAIFRSKKGPIQSLVPLPFCLVHGYWTELMIRVPIAIISTVNVFIIYLLGKRMFSKQMGLFSALIYASTGFAVAFSRILQYQSVVILSMLLTMLCLYEFLKSVNPRITEKYLLLGSLCFAFGFLSHYDILFFGPVGLFAWYKKFGLKDFYRKRIFVKAFSLFLIVALTFYVPFALNPKFGETADYYSQRRVGIGTSRLTHLDWFITIVSFYSSSYLLLFLLICSFFNFFRKKRHLELELIAVWFSSYFIPFALILARPGSHYYTLFPAWIILSLAGLQELYHLGIKKIIDRNAIKLPVFAICTLAMTIPIYYSQMLFIDHDPIYLQTFPENRNDFFITFYDEQPTEFLFGFPHKAGWKAVGYLFKSHNLTGNYMSNEESHITEYYIGDSPNEENSRYYIIAEQVQDEVELNKTHIEVDYDLNIVIYVNNKPMIYIYDVYSLIDESYIRYDLENFENSYDLKYRSF